MEKEKTFAAKVGRFVGTVCVTCVGVCIAACVIALTLRFITLLF